MDKITINLEVTPAGAELIVKALRAVTPLPDANVDSFVAELWTQYQSQAREHVEKQNAAQAAAANPEEPKPTPEGDQS